MRGLFFFRAGNSPKGWQIVAVVEAKRKPPEQIRKELHPEGLPESQRELLTGGLRVAATTGYFLATLRVAGGFIQSAKLSSQNFGLIPSARGLREFLPVCKLYRPPV